jgi:hypothetical protein
VRTAAERGARAEREVLNGNRGCLGEAERAQAYLASPFLWCKRSPDDACACPLNDGTTATYAVSATETKVITVGGKDVAPKAVPPFPGLGFERGGDDRRMTGVSLLKALSDEDSDRVETRDGVEIALAQGQGETEVALPLRPDLTVNALWKSEKYAGLALAQGELSAANSCVLPSSLKTDAYCLRSPEGRFDPVVFYVERRAASTPAYAVRQYHVKGGSGIGNLLAQFTGGAQTNVQFFTDTVFPYAKLLVEYEVSGVPQTDEFYYRVIEGQRTAYGELSPTISLIGGQRVVGTRVIERFVGDVIVVEPDPAFKRLHEVRLPDAALQDGRKLTLVLLDENLRAGGNITIDRGLTKERSGFVIPSLEDVLTGGVPVPVPGVG